MGHAGETTYRRDGLGHAEGDPAGVVLPATSEQVAAVMRLAHRAGVAVMPRGAGTSRCGGAIPLGRSLVIGTSRLRAILNFDRDLGTLRVQTGLRNLALSEAVAEAGWYYAPDPSSRRTCTIGGNIGSNASGACALRHGTTADQVLGLSAVLHDGRLLHLGCHAEAGTDPAHDLMAFLCGSEGQLAFVTEVTLQLQPLPEARLGLLLSFDTEAQALEAAAGALAAGVLLQRLEFMDAHAVALMESLAPSGHDTRAGASLLLELQGLAAEVAADRAELEERIPAWRPRTWQAASSEAAIEALWQGRSNIYQAVSRAGAFECLDVGVPLSRLSQGLEAVRRCAQAHALHHAVVAHAGDGTLHAFIVYPVGDPTAAIQARTCADDIRRACVALGGTISSEYGVGLARRELLGLEFDTTALAQQRLARRAFVPGEGLNPDKVLPPEGRP